ncbi:phage terminase small subunit-related protein [Paenibacillus macerans]|uniref:PBSX phage terminase small subunit-like N-terminal domain-containing protein n=1 Tax=Paenibacillus macerans TaxID=44252 RepID=A0A6N8F6I9_PAEMA|nr:phage terminase small subunit-related protein [Paenibacillus macerans]MEC0136137.1 phage terminase small subunit-related protein [Paenibacillus macerans]MUG26052.1 hypothetical protein [Paenibacillus macerans]
MGRKRDPNRDKAFEIYKASGGEIRLIDIAAQLDVSEGTVRGWKAKDKWDDQRNGTSNGTLQTNEKNAPINTERSDLNGTEQENVSWAEIENDYVTDIRKKGWTLEQLAKKYGISASSIMKYSAEHNWVEKRRKHTEGVKEKSAEITTHLLSNDIARATARHLRISDKLLKIVEDAINDDREFYKVVEKLRTGYGPGEFDEKIVVETVDALNDAKLVNVVNSFEKIQKAQRQTLRILDEKDQQKLDLERSKLEDEEEKPTEIVVRRWSK